MLQRSVRIRAKKQNDKVENVILFFTYNQSNPKAAAIKKQDLNASDFAADCLSAMSELPIEFAVALSILRLAVKFASNSLWLLPLKDKNNVGTKAMIIDIPKVI